MPTFYATLCLEYEASCLDVACEKAAEIEKLVRAELGPDGAWVDGTPEQEEPEEEEE
jgi:hypothetical protein